MIDLTVEQRTDEAGRESEARLRLALEAAHTATWDWGISTGELVWSVNATAVFGLPAGALGNSHVRFLDFIHPDDRARLCLTDDATIADGIRYAVEYRVTGLDGNVRWFSNHGRVLERESDGRAARIAGVTIDITERNAAAEALSASEARFRSLVQHASDMISILDANGLVRYEAPAVERVLGYTSAELVGTDPFTRIHADDVPRIREHLAEILRCQGATARSEFRYRHKDGSWRWLEAIGANMLDDRNVAGIVVNTRDVTARKLAEEALRESECRERTLAAVARRHVRELMLLDKVRTTLAHELELAVLL